MQPALKVSRAFVFVFRPPQKTLLARECARLKFYVSNFDCESKVRGESWRTDLWAHYNAICGLSPVDGTDGKVLTPPPTYCDSVASIFALFWQIFTYLLTIRRALWAPRASFSHLPSFWAPADRALARNRIGECCREGKMQPLRLSRKPCLKWLRETTQTILRLAASRARKGERFLWRRESKTRTHSSESLKYAMKRWICERAMIKFCH